jgi:hypothetical protein
MPFREPAVGIVPGLEAAQIDLDILFRHGKALVSEKATGCATRLQQAGNVMWVGFTSHFGPLACWLMMAGTFHILVESAQATKGGRKPFRLRDASRYATVI